MVNKKVGFFAASGTNYLDGTKALEDVAIIPDTPVDGLTTKQIDTLIDMFNIFGYQTDKAIILGWINSFLSTGSDFGNKNDVFAFWCWQSLGNDRSEDHYLKAGNESFGFLPFDINPFWTEEAYTALREALYSYNVQGNKKGFEEILHSKLKRRMKKALPVYLRFFDVYIPEYLKYYEKLTGVKIK